MVFNHTRIAQLPFSNAQMSSHTRIMKGAGIMGRGNGSVLLRLGGGGAGSSYQDIDDYVATTGINPYARGRKVSSGEGLGTGLKRISEKLAKLSVEQPSLTKPKMKKITMSL